MLSLLAFHDPDARVQGLDAVPSSDRPPVNVVRVSFQAMVAIGTGLAALAVVYLGVWARRRCLPRSRWFYRAVIAAGPLALVALIAGWVTTEVGRQPWVVYETMRTSQAVTEAGGVPVAYASLAAVYLSLLAAVIWLLRRLAGRPPSVEVDGPLEVDADAA
jgi:cytochrome d ubiquinol oxidase subunit I